MTVAVAWPKGFVQAPTQLTRIKDFLADNPVAVPVWLAVLGLAAFFLVAWFRVGRDPAKGLIVPLFEPPKGLSAAGVRVINRMGFDHKALAAALVEMAVKGWLIIEEEEGGFTFHRPGAKPPVPLSRPEELVLSSLCRGQDVLKATAGNHEKFSSAAKVLEKNLEREQTKEYFITNSGYFAGGVLLSFPALALSVMMSGDRDTMFVTGFLVVWLSIWTPASIGLWAASAPKFMALSFSFFAVMAKWMTATPRRVR